MRTLLVLLVAAAAAVAGDWPDETLDLFARLPVQEAGRVKPLSTLASFSLLRMNHQRSFRDSEGRKHDAMSWLLEALFYPEDARRERIFLVENADVLDDIGLPHEGKKRRDRYSYDDLFPARERLLSKAHEYSQIEAGDRTPVQDQLVPLAHNFMEFERLLQFLDFARAGDTIQKLVEGGGGADEIGHRFFAADALALLPPVDGSDTWHTPHDIVAEAANGKMPSEHHLRMLGLLNDLAAARNDPVAFRNVAREFFSASRHLADARGESRKIDLEVSLYRLDPFYKGLILYLFSFVLVAVGWMKPNKWLARAALAVSGGALALQTAGIVMRCILRGRPPVSTLYETVLFITGVVVLSSLVIEVINRRRIGLAAMPILGALGLFLAGRYEVIDGKDTMPQLVAVLDTNFWLATHVTCITIGYAAGLLASAIAHVFVLGRLFGLKRDDSAFYRTVARMVYGVICFALLFSTVGTILGGVWANDSWGRFWGWDPKENGALLIVLSQLALLHGRMGGYLKNFGVCVAAILGGGVVAFSWWGVNLLGIGLHTYGFTGGVFTGLVTFYAIEGAVLVATLVGWLVSRASAAPPPDASGGPESPGA